ncbi:hypothetical protein LCGC14_2054170, partial [marine sediment metagenome]
ILIQELHNPRFISIVMESPRNKIEDNNIIYRNQIRFIQVKKKDQEQWTKSRIAPIIDHFYYIYDNPKKCVVELNIPDYIDYNFQFQFITDGEFNSQIYHFSLALEKLINQEILEEDEKKSLDLFKKPEYSKYEEFLMHLDLKNKHHSSSNKDDNCETIKKICIFELHKSSNLNHKDSEEIVEILLDKCIEKSRGSKISARTLRRIELSELIGKKKSLEYIPGDNEAIKNLKKIFIEIITDIKDKIKYNCLIKDKEYNFSHIVPIIFQVYNKSYYVIIFPDKVTQTILNNFILLEEIIIKKKKGIPMFINTGNLKDFGGISEKYCIPLDKDKILEFLKIE